jgi:hypothetical protein
MRSHYKHCSRPPAARFRHRLKIDHRILAALALQSSSHGGDGEPIPLEDVRESLDLMRHTGPDQMRGVTSVARLIIDSPESMINYLNPEDFHILTRFLTCLECQRWVLYAFCFIAQLLDPDPDAERIALLERNQFPEILLSILTAEQSVEIRAITIYVAAYFLPLGKYFYDVLFEDETVHSILEFESNDNIILLATAHFIRYAATCAYDEENQPNLCNRLLSMCRDEDEDIRECGLLGLHESSVKSFCALNMIMNDPELVADLTKSIISENRRVSRAAISLLTDCIQCPDFPMEALLECETLAIIVECLNSESAKLIGVVIAFIKQWVILPGQPFVAELLTAFRDFDQMQLFSSASFDQKCELLNLYQGIVNLNEAELLGQFYSREWIEVLCEFVVIGGSFPAIIVDVIAAIGGMCPVEVSNEIFSVIAGHDAFEHLQQILEEPEEGGGATHANILTLIQQIGASGVLDDEEAPTW